MSVTYSQSGVDPQRAHSMLARFKESCPKDPKLLGGIGGFAAVYSISEKLKGLKDPVLVSCCDGVGTKLKLALQWKKVEGLGQDLVGMNVNDMLCAGALPLLFLDYYATGHVEQEASLKILNGILKACEETGCKLVGGETAEMPGLYQEGDFDLAGFCVGIADSGDCLGPHKVKAGDILIGLPSSGFHSNGYSLVRKLVEKDKIDPNTKPSFSEKTWAEILLEPTTLYVNTLRPILSQINAAAHITGGGLYENLPRVIPKDLSAQLDKEQWKLTPLFEWAQKVSELSFDELLKVFNGGMGMILIVSEKEVASVIQQTQQLEPRILGSIVSSKTEAQIKWLNA